MVINMKIHASAEDYLERILILSENNDELHAIDIARSMNFSKPSVSIALKKLQENKLIEIDDNLHIHLTETGRDIATKVYEKHTIISKALISLGVDEKIAKEDACKLEHVLSEESFDAIKKFINKNR